MWHRHCWCVCEAAGPSPPPWVLCVYRLWHKPETEGPFLCGRSNLLWKACPRAGHATRRLRRGHCVPQVNQQICTQHCSPTSPCCNLFSKCSGPLLSWNFLFTLVLSLLMKCRFPLPLLTDSHCCVMPAFTTNGKLFWSESPCQPHGVFSPQFISAANGHQPNLNQTEFNIWNGFCFYSINL